MIDPSRILDAQSLLARHFGPTRIARAASLSSPGRDVFLKIETELPTGSFKVRGAIYALSMHLARGTVEPCPAEAQRATAGEVVCASTGNHGAAVAYAARLLGVPATIFLPDRPNPVKAARIRELGARLVEAGIDLSAAIDATREYAARAPAFFLHDASDPDVPAGTATIGLEIVAQLPAVDVIYVPMGDTALIRGVASAAKRHRSSIRIVGVVAARADAYQMSWRTGDVVETATCDTIADGLAIRRPLAANVAAIRELVDEVVSVSEEEMRDAIELLAAREQVIAEPAGAAAAAALMARPWSTGTTVALVTGGNIAPDLMPAAMKR
jgi:threonine dehydratase